VGDRATLTGILFVLKTGIPWQMGPKEMGRGSGMTCWRRLTEWHEAGVWRRLHRVLLDHPGKADRIGWSRASLDSASGPAPEGAKRPAESDRGKQGSKRHSVVDKGGVPLVVRHTAADARDSTMFDEMVDSIETIR
jgi:transposase